MQLLGLILLLASSWYLWKLTSNFLDEPTKKELTNSFNNLKNKLSEGKQNFSKAKISEAWEKYKEEGGALSNNCLLYTSPSPRDISRSRMPSSA